ncbi:tyrosine-type recombinase/integrase [Streptomyces sp. GQFP]|uniref:tyrosine-type recombinase/integrase n=1 Tax=Streptomyces sp. GQFP TaxID=2907545 RepID=UPI001F2E6A98|nr:site-specific integrase [Streptomyces sp. GQFP]UIX34345.1 site-specific integrase [Streptomyces sp. GQFP]
MDLIGKLAGDLPDVHTETTRERRLLVVRMLLRHLDQFPGGTWQERWEASGLNDAKTPVRDRESTKERRAFITTGLKTVLALRLIQPSLEAFRSNKFMGYQGMFLPAQGDPLVDQFVAAVSRHEVSQVHRDHALFDVAFALTCHGLSFADLSPEALLYHSQECRRLGLTTANIGDPRRHQGQVAWQVLHRMGHFPDGTPPRMKELLLPGQRSIEELVAFRPIGSGPVRQLIIDYLTRRASEVDYSTLKNLARTIAHTFWRKIEAINPGQRDLHIDQAVYAQWKAELRLRENGKPRTDAEHILLQVRSFYLDLHSWAVEEPERWAAWAAPCPISRGDLRGFGARRRLQERTDDRTRQRQPLLPILVAHVETRFEDAQDFLAVASSASPGACFVHKGRQYCRTLEGPCDFAGDPIIHVRDTESSELIDATASEESLFWEWATVEVLRHTGIRIEELVELSQLSVRQYQRPNGEVIALLVIAPSKTDRERVIPMSAELFHVIAAIIRRLTRHGRKIPLLSRYDQHEKTWSAPMPFLFQRQRGGTTAVISPQRVLKLLSRRCEALAEQHVGFQGLVFTPHDFRRLFATELVNSGLPIHIGAALLGHLNLQTTRGYVTVFNEDVVRHYQEFLLRRRSLRPQEEYRVATGEEWDEFEEYFDKRKVELGSCGRPYGTPCAHEHACICCPMLQIGPKMIPRLDEIEIDLQQRRERAEREGWRGEIEGIDLTMSFLQAKRIEALRSQRLGQHVDLGLPNPAAARRD